MDQLKTLMAADYRFGYNNGHGADGTVRSIEDALAQLASENPERYNVASNSAGYAANSLEQRLFAAYAVRALAFAKAGKPVQAKTEYDKAVALIGLAARSNDFTPTLRESNANVEEVLAVLERRLRQAGVNFAVAHPGIH